MSHFARIEDNLVVEVIVAEQDFVDQLSGTWIQTSYNTAGNQHLLGGTPLRKNFAGVGYSYDSELDAFIPPQPFASWQLDTVTGTWQAPKPLPDQERGWHWDEESQNWIKLY